MDNLTSASTDSCVSNLGTAEVGERVSLEGNHVARVQALLAQRLNELTSQKEEWERKLKARREERLQMEKDVGSIQIKNAVLRSTVDRIATENADLSKNLEELKSKLSTKKEKLASLPSETFMNQQQQLDACNEALNSVTSMFAQFKSSDAIENAFNTKLIQAEQSKRKVKDTDQKLSDIEERVIAVNKSKKGIPLQTLEAVVAAVNRDITDIELNLEKESAKENQHHQKLVV